MPTLFHLDSSPLVGVSVSRELASEFVQAWRKTNPDGKVIYRDLTAGVPPVIDAAWITAVYTPEASRTAEQNALLSLSDTLIGELQEADEYVISAPMHNFAIPSTLKLWIDQITRVGKTFQYGASGPEGLLKNKKATLLTASGGVYTVENGLAGLNFVDPYLRTVFGFLGVTDVNVVNASGTAALMQGADRKALIAPFAAQTVSLATKA